MDAPFGQIRRHLAARHGDIDESRRHPFNEIGLAVQERQPARLGFVDDGNLDSVNQRDAPAGQLGCDGLAFGIVGIGLGRPQPRAIRGVALEHDARRAPPRGQTHRAGAHRVLGDALAIRRHHLAGNGAIGVGRGQYLHQTRALFFQCELHGVAAQCAQTVDGLVVIEGFFLRQRFFAECGQADDSRVFQVSPGGAFQGRVRKPFVGEYKVFGHQFARFSFEGRVVSKVDAGLDVDRPYAEIGADLGQARRHQRHHLGRPRQVVVVVERLEDVRGDGDGIHVADLGRVEATFGDLEGIAQHTLAGCGRPVGADRAGRAGHRGQRPYRRRCQATHQRVSQHLAAFHGAPVA